MAFRFPPLYPSEDRASSDEAVSASSSRASTPDSEIRNTPDGFSPARLGVQPPAPLPPREQLKRLQSHLEERMPAFRDGLRQLKEAHLTPERPPLDVAKKIMRARRQVLADTQEELASVEKRLSEFRGIGAFKKLTQKSEYESLTTQRTLLEGQVANAQQRIEELLELPTPETMIARADFVATEMQQELRDINIAMAHIRHGLAQDTDKDAALRELHELQTQVDEISHERNRLTIQHRLQSSLRAGNDPQPTSTGYSGSFLVRGPNGEILGVFKPASMEPGAAHNARVASDYGINIAFRNSILPGQAAGNEVLVHTTDQAMGGRYQVPTTHLVKLDHPDFKGRELGSVQGFLPGATPLIELSPLELEQIPRQEFDRFNLSLLTGNTDGHFGNFLYNKEKKSLGLIDGGFHFPGSADHNALVDNHWVNLRQAYQPMSRGEYEHLRNIDIDGVMAATDKQVQRNVALDPNLAMDADKMLGFKLRLELGKMVGDYGAYGITQHDWYDMLATTRFMIPPYELIFQREIAPHLKRGADWKTVDAAVDWNAVRQQLRAAVEHGLVYTGKARPAAPQPTRMR